MIMSLPLAVQVFFLTLPVYVFVLVSSAVKLHRGLSCNFLHYCILPSVPGHYINDELAVLNPLLSLMKIRW
jgi:hypothetical protein